MRMMSYVRGYSPRLGAANGLGRFIMDWLESNPCRDCHVEDHRNWSVSGSKCDVEAGIIEERYLLGKES